MHILQSKAGFIFNGIHIETYTIINYLDDD